MGPRHLGLVCTGLSALFIDDGDIDHLPSLISLKLFLGLPTDWTPLEAGTEKPVGVIHAFRLLEQIQVGRGGKVDLCHFSSSTKCMSHALHSLGSHLHQKIIHVGGWAGLTHLTMSPLRACTAPLPMGISPDHVKCLHGLGGQ